MRMGRVLLATSALLGLAACPGPTECLVDAISSPPSAPALVLVGQPAEVSFPLSWNLCGERQGPAQERLSVEVYSPDNRLVENTAQLNASAGVVRFTPEVPGSYHLMAAFEPVGGLQQVDVLAAQERSAESVAQQLPRPCEVLEHTARGSWICDAQVLRDEKVAQTLTNADPSRPLRVAVSGDAVWTVDTQTVRRYVDTDGTLVLTGSLAHQDALPEFLLASDGELVALTAQVLHRFTFAGEALQRTGMTGWETDERFFAGPLEPRAFLVRAGDVLATVQHSLTDQGVQVSRACTYQLDGGAYTRTAAPCQTLTGLPTGVEDGVLWTAEQTQTVGFAPILVVRRFTLGPGGFAQQASMMAGTLFQVIASLYRASSAPVLTNSQGLWAVVAWRPSRQDLVLEVLDRVLQEPRASSDLYWLQVGTGTRVRLRPPPR